MGTRFGLFSVFSSITDHVLERIHWNNTYKGLRLVGKSYSFYYSVWCNNEHELYDLYVCIDDFASLDILQCLRSNRMTRAN